MASVAVMVRFAVPLAVGVPLIAPVAVLRLRPGARLPAVMAKLYGAVPPAALMVAEYGVPVVPLPSDAGVRVKVGALTVIVTVAALEVPPAFVAV